MEDLMYDDSIWEEDDDWENDKDWDQFNELWQDFSEEDDVDWMKEKLASKRSQDEKPTKRRLNSSLVSEFQTN